MNPVQKYTKAGATHGYLCLEVVRFTFKNRQLNCGHRPLSSLGYSRHESIMFSYCLVFILSLYKPISVSITCAVAFVQKRNSQCEAFQLPMIDQFKSSNNIISQFLYQAAAAADAPIYSGND